MDFEEMVLQKQESIEDSCKTCPYAEDNGKACRNQCMETTEHYAPYLYAYTNKRN